jgi:large subunit ribosomal protein L32e
MKRKRFLRTGVTQYSKLGFRRKNKQKYRKSKGGENKIRLKMKGHLTNVSIGYRTEKIKRGLVRNMSPVLVNNLQELKKSKDNQSIIIAKIGQKKKMELAKYAIEKNIKILNLNPKKFLDKVEEEKKKSKEEKKQRESKIKEKEKKVKEKEKSDDKKEEESQDKKEERLEDTINNIESNAKENVEDKK